MIHFLLALLSLVQLAEGALTNTTSSDNCPPSNGTTRNMLDILGSCAVTLVICVWHTIHMDVPDEAWLATFLKALSGLGAFFAPEVLVTVAAVSWWNARKQVNHFHEKGYEWSMTHSFFAEMGGFVYRNESGNLETLDSLRFLKLCEANKIANPVITVKEIKALSKSDAIGKTIFAFHLLWFMLHAVVRRSRGLVVTLVELDTASMAVLSLFIIFSWLDKPLSPESPHTFYYLPPGVELYPRTQSLLSNAWKPEPSFLNRLITWLRCAWKYQPITDEEETTLAGVNEMIFCSKTSKFIDKILSKDLVTIGSLSGTWMILGGLHLLAWNYEFPTEAEKIMWRIASLILATGPPAFLVMIVVALVPLAILTLAYGFEPSDQVFETIAEAVCWFVGISGVVARAFLVGLMLASLRSLPSSAYQTVSWTMYIPHL